MGARKVHIAATVVLEEAHVALEALHQPGLYGVIITYTIAPNLGTGSGDGGERGLPGVFTTLFTRRFTTLFDTFFCYLGFEGCNDYRTVYHTG